MKKTKKEDRGFIVHPFETGDGKYHASYDNHNKTIKAFNTKREAVSYLKRKKVPSYLYDAPHGIQSTKVSIKPRKRRRSQGFGFGSFKF